MNTSPRRAFVKIGRFDPGDIAVNRRLSGSELLVLLMMTLLCPWQTQVYSGTYAELAERTGLPTRAVSKATSMLTSKGLLSVEEPFSPGRGGSVRVECYWDIVVPEVRQTRRTEMATRGKSEESQGPLRAEFAHTSRPLRANPQELETLTRTFTVKGGSEEGRGEVSGGAEVGKTADVTKNDALCVACGESVTGHPFGDHEPIAATPIASTPSTIMSVGVTARAFTASPTATPTRHGPATWMTYTDEEAQAVTDRDVEGWSAAAAAFDGQAGWEATP